MSNAPASTKRACSHLELRRDADTWYCVEPYCEFEIRPFETTRDEDPADTARLDFIEEECVELRCKESRNHDDADVYYEIVRFYMSTPREKVVGHGSTPRGAIDYAMENADDKCAYCDGDGCTLCKPITPEEPTPRTLDATLNCPDCGAGRVAPGWKHDCSALRPTPLAHTTEEDFQHWLSYSDGKGDLRQAFYAGANVSPLQKASAPIPPLCDCDPDFGCKEYDSKIFRCCQREMEERAALQKASELDTTHERVGVHENGDPL